MSDYGTKNEPGIGTTVNVSQFGSSKPSVTKTNFTHDCITTKNGHGINHEKLIMEGKDASTVYSKTVIDYGAQLGDRNGYYRISQKMYPGFPPRNYTFYATYSAFNCQAASKIGTTPASWVQTRIKVENNARLKAMASAQGASAEVPTALAELGKTLHMIRHPLKGIGDLLKGLRQGKASAVSRAKNPLELARIANDTYLEYLYGWKSLAHDVEDILDTAGEIVSSKMKTRHAYGMAEDNYGYSWESPAAYHGDFPSSRWIGNAKFHYSARARGGYAMDIGWDGGKTADQLKAFGFSVDNLASTVWELIPYSFVVDWIFPVQDLMKAASAAGQTWRYFVLTTKETRIAEGDLSLGQRPSPGIGLIWGKWEGTGHTYAEHVYITRKKILPTFDFLQRPGDFFNPAGAERTEGYSLALQAIGQRLGLNSLFSNRARHLGM